MHNDKPNPFAKALNKKLQDCDFNAFKRCSFFPELLLEEAEENQKPLERAFRSKSHFHYNCRPEFVPKPKPKRTRVIPSPMRLKSKFVSSNHESDNCLSPLESDGELVLEEVDNEEITEKMDVAINSMRKIFAKLKTSPVKKQSKDSEQVKTSSNALNQSQRRSVFTKTVKEFIEDKGDSNKNLTMSIGVNNPPKRFSILNVLEQTAENMNQTNLMKCKSTIL